MHVAGCECIFVTFPSVSSQIRHYRNGTYRSFQPFPAGCAPASPNNLGLGISKDRDNFQTTDVDQASKTEVAQLRTFLRNRDPPRAPTGTPTIIEALPRIYTKCPLAALRRTLQ